jgi:hypothetical protein
MRATSVLDKRTELALGIVIVQHAIIWMTLQQDEEAVTVLETSLALLQAYWGIVSCREK